MGLILWLRPLAEGPPLFTIEHSIEFAGAPEEVWSVFMDGEHYPDWNPYLLTLEGEPEVGGEIGISILQANWDQPMNLTPLVTGVSPPRLLAWRGDLWPPGLLRTDHSFQIEALGDDRVRFIQREEFRGKLAEFFDDDAKGHTEDAFRAMDEALAARVAALRAAKPH